MLFVSKAKIKVFGIFFQLEVAFFYLFIAILSQAHMAHILAPKFTLKNHSEPMSLSIFPCTTIILEHLSHSGFVASLMQKNNLINVFTPSSKLEKNLL